jgi:hypothetical protein
MFAGKKEFWSSRVFRLSILAASNNAKGRPALKRRVESAFRRPVNFAREKEGGDLGRWGIGWDGMGWDGR